MIRKDIYEPRHRRGHRRGPSSFWMHDPEKVFAGLNLKPGERFLDLGCGPGDYSIQASKLVGSSGLVYALDKSADAIARIKQKALNEQSRGKPRGIEWNPDITAASSGVLDPIQKNEKCTNIRVMQTDIFDPLPLDDGCVDLCLLATVLHIIRVKPSPQTLFAEVHRVLRPGGRLAVIECKKEDQPFGPPQHIRLSPSEVEEALRGSGLKRASLVDLGFNYLLQFVAS